VTIADPLLNSGTAADSITGTAVNGGYSLFIVELPIGS